MMKDAWRSLQIGDRVRIKRWPKEMHEDRLHEDTKSLYRWLIDTQRILSITEIDAYGLPLGHIDRVVGGVERSEYLAVNHGDLEVVS